MNILFLALSFSEGGRVSSYETLLRTFQKYGDKIFVACACEKRSSESPGIYTDKEMTILRVATGNMTGNIGLIEKGISTITIDSLFKKAIKKHYNEVKFDLIMYPTPPITLVNTVEYIKRRTGAKTYLLLKDIFPQNAVDMGMMSKSGIKGILYHHFRNKEKKLYAVSDFIGCMSPANVEYVVRHNPEVNPEIVEVCPNCCRIPQEDPTLMERDSTLLRAKYNIPNDAVIFLYGGNLGKPQGIPFLINCLDKIKNNGKVFFIIIGEGSEYHKLRKFVDESGIKNTILLDYLPKAEYQEIANKCDVGLIFLDYRFSIPNFPSRSLACLTSAMPMLVATDPVCDMGDIAEANGFGVKCLSNDPESFAKAVDMMVKANRKDMGKNAWKFFLDNYTVDIAYSIIMKHFDN